MDKVLLAIDIGNTDAVFAIFKDEALLKLWRFKTPMLSDFEALTARFGVEGVDVAGIGGVVISSVVPDVDLSIQEFSKSVLGHVPVVVSHEMAGLSILIDRPEELGSDRIVNGVAVLAHYKAPAIVVDFGTATTFDVIGSDGAYCGGVIAPGVNLSVSALHQAAAKLPEVDVAKPYCVIGSDTVSAIQSGIYWGYVGLVEGIVKRVSDEMGETPFVLATGGLANLFAENISIIDAVDNELTLKGLLKIYQGHISA